MKVIVLTRGDLTETVWKFSEAPTGKRMLGIPTVSDRMIQQATSQVLTPIFEE